MKRIVILAALFSATGASATEQAKNWELQAQFSEALALVMDQTDQVTQQSTVQGEAPTAQYKVSGAPLMLADYDSGKITAQITSSIKTPAGKILGQVSDIVAEMAIGLYEGVNHPSEVTKEKVCATIYRGYDVKRTAPFYPGYAELHHVYQNYLNQFEAVESILACPTPF